MPSGGSVVGCNINGRYFPVDAEAEVTKQLSGYKNENKPNGDKSSRLVKSVVLGMVEGLKVQIDNAREDLEFLQATADSSAYFDFDMTEIDGTVYSGSMQIIDEIKVSSKEATAEIKLSGTLAKQ